MIFYNCFYLDFENVSVLIVLFFCFIYFGNVLDCFGTVVVEVLDCFCGYYLDGECRGLIVEVEGEQSASTTIEFKLTHYL